MAIFLYEQEVKKWRFRDYDPPRWGLRETEFAYVTKRTAEKKITVSGKGLIQKVLQTNFFKFPQISHPEDLLEYSKELENQLGSGYISYFHLRAEGSFKNPKKMNYAQEMSVFPSFKMSDGREYGISELGLPFTYNLREKEEFKRCDGMIGLGRRIDDFFTAFSLDSVIESCDLTEAQQMYDLFTSAFNKLIV